MSFTKARNRRAAGDKVRSPSRTIVGVAHRTGGIEIRRRELGHAGPIDPGCTPERAAGGEDKGAIEEQTGKNDTPPAKAKDVVKK